MASPEALQNYNLFLRRYAAQNQRQLDALEERQRSQEKEIINKTDSFCPLRQIQDVTATSEKVMQALHEGFDDANVLKSVMCLNNSMAIFPGSTEDDIGRSFKIRKYLRNLQQIGGESAEGYAMTSEIRPFEDKSNVLASASKPFVAKSPRKTTEKGNEGILHEYFVGAFGTNTLRSFIPNFAFVLGMFQCSPPYIDYESYVTNNPDDDSRKALTYCQNDVRTNQVNYMLLENITGSTTIAEFIQNGASFPEYLNVFTQVVLALHVAQAIGFTHYDLHSQNVLVLPLLEPMTIEYDKGLYLQTRHLAFIIDYGRSHIIYAGNHFGFQGVAIGTYPDRAYPMHDIYKLLLFSLFDSAFGERDYRQFAGRSDSQLLQQGLLTNPDIFENAKLMVKYFYPELNLNQTANYLIQTRGYFYTLPYSPEFDISVLNFYQNAIASTYPTMVRSFISDQPPADLESLYGCARKGYCSTLRGALRNYAAPDMDFINDPYVFYEILLETVNSNAKLVDLDKIIADGSQYYQNYIQKLDEDALKKIQSYEQIVRSLAPASLRGAVPEWIKFGPNSLQLYRGFVAKIVRLVDLMNDLLEIQTITDIINEIYYQQAINPAYIEQIERLKATVPQVNANLASIKADAQYVQRLNPRQILEINPDASWLFEKLPSVPSAVVPVTL